MKNDERPTAIVTDASERVALHVIRALGRKGVRVHAVEIEGRSTCPIGFLSRYTAETTMLPAWGATSSEAWAEALLSIGKPGDVLMPSCLNTILRILEHRQALSEKFRFLLPPEEVLRRANNKWELYKIAQQMGIRTPATYRPRSEKEAREIAEEITYPAILKLRHDENVYLAPVHRRRVVHSSNEFMEAWREMHQLQRTPIVQEFIRGQGYGFEALYDEQRRLVAFCAHRRLVEFPPSGGPSAVCETIHSEELVEVSQRLLDRIGWVGVVMLEFKRSRRGDFLLLEANPRFWGSISLPEVAGLNFPFAYYRIASGRDFDPPPYKVGVRLRLTHLLLASAYVSFRASPLAFWKWLPQLFYVLDVGTHEGLCVIDDLRPVFAYITQRSSVDTGR